MKKVLFFTAVLLLGLAACTPDDVLVTSVTVSQRTLELTVGETEALTATILPENATNQNVAWTSSDAAIATVSSNGAVTAVSAGEATITVTTACGGRTATSTVTVSPQTVSVTGVNLDKTEFSLAVGDSETLTATVLPENATNQSVTWESSDADVATVDENGEVTAVSTGTATITVTTEDGNRTATAEVTVSAATVSVTGVNLDKTELSLTVSDSETLTATVLPENATNRNVTWASSDTDVATVNNNGEVTAVSTGTATITVTTEDGNRTADAEVTVTPAPILVTSVQIDRTKVFLTLGGDSETVSAFVFPLDATNQNVSWEIANTNIATVDDDGVVTAVAVGETTITVTAECGEHTDTIPVEVEPATVSVTGVSLDRTEISLVAGEMATLIHTIAPVNATNQDVTWGSTDRTVATVDDNGQVTAVAAGTAVIIVTTEDGDFAAACEVTVRIPVTGVTLNRTAITLHVGSVETLWATIEPFYATNRNVTWTSSNPAVADIIVDEYGATVTAVSAGTATITVTTADGNHTATATVEVEPATVSVTGVNLNKTEVSLVAGNTERLIATVLPENATNKRVEWSSLNSAVATVDNNGVVTAVSAGSTFIFVNTEDGDFGANALVTVTVPVTGVSLSINAIILDVGETESLWATVQPTNATNRNVTWASSNSEVATVDVNPLGMAIVTAVSAGTATITATTVDGNHTATATVEAVGTTDAGVVIDGIRWATRNVSLPGTFAPYPESAGMFYQWNRPVGWSNRNPLVNSNRGTTWDSTIPSGTEWYSHNDPCPAGWRVPTRVELESLRNSGSEETARNGVNGRIFGTAPNQIFLPTTGRRHTDGFLLTSEFVTLYWSSARSGEDNAWTLDFRWGHNVNTIFHNRANGLPIRCVAE